MIYEKYFKLVPEVYRKSAYIVGGAAVDFDKAGDVDICILTSDPPEIVDAHFLIHLRERWKSKLKDFKFYYQVFNLLGNIEGQDKKVQVLISKYAIERVLSSFDLSTHQLALDIEGELYEGDGRSEIDEDIVVKTWHRATPRRVLKLMDRYDIGMSELSVESSFRSVLLGY